MCCVEGSVCGLRGTVCWIQCTVQCRLFMAMKSDFTAVRFNRMVGYGECFWFNVQRQEQIVCGKV